MKTDDILTPGIIIHRMRVYGFAVLGILFGFIVFVFFSSRARAHSPQTIFMRGFQSERVLFPDENSEYSRSVPGRDPALMRWFLQDLLAWNPSGKPAFFSPGCKPELWADKLMGKKAHVQGQILNSFLRVCATELETGVHQQWIHSLKIMSIQLDLENHPFLHRVVFRLPNGDVLKGRIALKGDLKKRPLIIFRLGVFGTSEEFKPERFIFMMLFEQTPFNVLVLDNSTGPDYLAMNSKVALGGFSEGLQNMWIAKVLTDPAEPLSQIVGALHMVGMSLGGHGVLFASLLNEFNLNENGQKRIESFFGFCPVVHLKTNIDHLLEAGLFGLGVEFWSRYRLQSLDLPNQNLLSWNWLRSLDWLSWLTLQPIFLKKAMSQVENEFSNEMPKKLGLNLPPKMRGRRSFWEAQNFWPSYQDVHSPVMIWGNKNDILVPIAENAGSLSRENIAVVQFPVGYHCTLPIGYDWSAISRMLRASLVSQGPLMTMEKDSVRIELAQSYDATPGAWLIDQFEWNGDQPQDIGLLLRHRSFPQQIIHAIIPLKRLDFRFRNSQLSLSEKQMLERWIFQNVQIVGNRSDSSSRRTLWLQWVRVP